jgi:hypothetical protein
MTDIGQQTFGWIRLRAQTLLRTDLAFFDVASIGIKSYGSIPVTEEEILPLRWANMTSEALKARA